VVAFALMPRAEHIINFSDVSFQFGDHKPILDEANFSVREGMKVTLMGQNGAGKSTIFGLILDELKPESGRINRAQKLSIAASRQVIPREDLGLSVREFFEKQFSEKIYDIDPRIDGVLEIVNFHVSKEKLVQDLSGGQQARILLASALIVDPDLLLLDEPTNNLDVAGIAHLTAFLQNYHKTCIVISHDAEFLNAFSDGVFYLDVFTRKVEQYVGNYYDVVEQITARVEKEQRENARLSKKIQDNKDKSNFFAHKGGKMRFLAKKLREEAQEIEENKVDVRREDKTIRPFIIEEQEDMGGDIVRVSSYQMMINHEVVTKKADIVLKKNQHLLLAGPNGIGKSTFLESIANNEAEGVVIQEGIDICYYRQDFSTLNFEHTVKEALFSVMKNQVEQDMRSCAAGFLISGEMMNTKVGDLSEGQKGLVAFAQIALQKPGLLILDEPTNHINFRHIPIIAEALDAYKGTMILVSHVPEFFAQIRIDDVLEMEP
jgi:ATP-binding cassette subfamily F protein 3